MTAAARKTRPRATRSGPASGRTGLIGKIHVARKQLGLDEDSYRAILHRETGQDSCKAMTIAQLEAVLRAMHAAGFKPTAPKRAGRRPLADSEAAGKLRALWLDGWHLGVVQDSSEAALSAWVKRVTGGRRKGIDALHWLTEDDAAKAIEGLKAWLAREAGVSWDAYRDPITRQTWYDPARRVVEAQAKALGLPWREALAVGGHVGWFAVGEAQATALIAALGERVRAKGRG